MFLKCNVYKIQFHWLKPNPDIVREVLRSWSDPSESVYRTIKRTRTQQTGADFIQIANYNDSELNFNNRDHRTMAMWKFL